jgi:hypothetical protein
MGLGRVHDSSRHHKTFTFVKGTTYSDLEKNGTLLVGNENFLGRDIIRSKISQKKSNINELSSEVFIYGLTFIIVSLRCPAPSRITNSVSYQSLIFALAVIWFLEDNYTFPC